MRRFESSDVVEALEKHPDANDPTKLTYWVLDVLAGSRLGGHVAADLNDMAGDSGTVVAPHLAEIRETLS